MRVKFLFAVVVLVAGFTWATISSREARHEYHRQLGQGVIDALGLGRAKCESPAPVPEKSRPEAPVLKTEKKAETKVRAARGAQDTQLVREEIGSDGRGYIHYGTPDYERFYGYGAWVCNPAGCFWRYLD